MRKSHNVLQNCMKNRKSLFIDNFNGLFSTQLEKPASSLYAFIPLSIFGTLHNSNELCTQLMTQHNIACVPVVSFGQKDYLRMAFSEKEEVICEGIRALCKMVK